MESVPPHTVMSSAEDSPSAPSEEHPVSSDRDTQTDFMITRIISDATLLSSLRSALGVEGQTNASAPNSSSTDNEGLQAQSVQGNRPVEGTRKNSGQPARHVTLNIEKSTLGQPTRHVTEEPVEQPPRHATNMNAESADYDYQGDFYQDCSASDSWFVDEQWPSEATLDFSNLSAGSGRFKPSTEVTQFVSKYSSQTLSREERTVVMRKYPRPDIPILKAPEVDSYATSFLKAKFPAQEDKRLKRIYGAVSDAMAPLVAYMQAVEESGMQDESDPALQAVKAAAVLVGNAAALINEERRDVVLTAMNPAMKSSGPNWPSKQMPRREPPCLAQHLLTLWSRTQTPRDHWAEQLHPLVLVVIFLAGPRSSAGGRGASLTTARTPEISVTAADTFRPDTNRDSRSSGDLGEAGVGYRRCQPQAIRRNNWDNEQELRITVSASPDASSRRKVAFLPPNMAEGHKRSLGAERRRRGLSSLDLPTLPASVALRAEVSRRSRSCSPGRGGSTARETGNYGDPCSGTAKQFSERAVRYPQTQWKMETNNRSARAEPLR